MLLLTCYLCIHFTCFDCIYFVGVIIHMIAICKYLLTCVYVYFLQKSFKKNQNGKYFISS